MNFLIVLTLFVLFLFPFSGIQNAIVFGETNDGVDKDLRSMLFSIIQNIIGVTSFLLGTSSFLLGLYINGFSKLPEMMHRYLKILILALVFPTLFIIVYGISIIGIKIEPEDIYHQIILSVLFIPASIILLLVVKLHFRLKNQKKDQT